MRLNERLQTEFTPLTKHKALDDRIEPLLKGCESVLNGFTKDNDEMKEAILEFDVALSLKANSFAITECKEWVEKEFISFKRNEAISAGLDKFRTSVF